MQQGDIIVVRLDAGPRLARFIETKSNRVRVSIGRNREARLPVSRVIHETGLTAERYETVEELSREANAIAESVDLEEVWDVVCDDSDALTLTDIAELYWADEPSPKQSIGLLFHLLADDLRFVRDGSHYLPRDRETVAQTPGTAPASGRARRRLGGVGRRVQVRRTSRRTHQLPVQHARPGKGLRPSRGRLQSRQSRETLPGRGGREGARPRSVRRSRNWSLSV